jgi:geranylgeranyl diphosphate synthase type II
MEQAGPDREPRRYLYEPMREFIARPAKALRPALCLATCRSYGGTVDDAIPSAAGLELLHHAFLVHDDVEDGSLKRRGGSAMHRQIGEALAINAGDALNAYAMRMFRSNLDRFPPERALAILDEVDHLFVETLEGQAVELGWQRGAHTNVGVEDYLRMVLKKTAWYSFIHPMRIGALVAGAPAGPDLDRFNRFGFLLGAAFQIQDDVLNLTGATSRYGKEIGGDLWEGKRTMVLAHSLSHVSPGERRVLEQFLSRPREERLPRQVSVVSDILEQTGALHWARSAALALVDGARQEFETAFARAQEGADLDFLRSMPAYLVERDV